MHDVAIIGSGPAGMACAISARLDGLTVALYGVQHGGQIATTSRLANYPSWQSISGKMFADKLYRQAVKARVDIIEESITEVSKVSARAKVLALGMTFRRLGGAIDKYVRRGVFYGATPTTCSGVALIIGGANSAGQMALYLASHGCKVIMCLRGTSLDQTMSAYLVRDIMSSSAIRIITCTEVCSCNGDHRIREVELSTGERIDVNRVYVFIGQTPNTGMCQSTVACDHDGYVMVDRSYATSVGGVYAIGDCRVGSIHRVASAIGDGSNVVPSLYKYLEKQ